MNKREALTTFEVVVGRIATRDLAYVWHVEDGEQAGMRLPLKRSVVSDPTGQFVEISEGMHLTVDVDPADPTRITCARAHTN
jgi:hypothetical protein